MKLILKSSTLENKREETDAHGSTQSETPFIPTFGADRNKIDILDLIVEEYVDGYLK